MSTTTTYAVTGMTCSHCAATVTEELRAVPGVQEVEVDLAAGGASQVRVVSDAPLDEQSVRVAVDEAGYTLEGQAP
jgi:copper chaperone CopZ